MKQFELPAHLSRRMPDPVFGPEYTRYTFYVPVRDVPPNIPLDADPRVPKLNKRIYKQVEQSLLDQGDNIPGTFHLKHKGITLIARDVQSAGEGGLHTITVDEGQGIVDGGHSYELI